MALVSIETVDVTEAGKRSKARYQLLQRLVCTYPKSYSPEELNAVHEAKQAKASSDSCPPDDA